MEIVRNMNCVDAVISQETMDKFSVWEKLKFDVMIVGDDWYNTSKWNEIEDKFRTVGVRTVYFPYTRGTSSTIINKLIINEREQLDRQTAGMIDNIQVLNG